MFCFNEILCWIPIALQQTKLNIMLRFDIWFSMKQFA